MNPKTILVAVDFSPCSLVALEKAGRMASQCGASLHVIHAVNSKDVYQIATAVPFSRSEFEEQLKERVHAQLQEAVDGQLIGVDAVLHAMIGHPLKSVQKTIKDINADLLVIGAFGDGGPGRGASAFSTQCARNSSINVLLVHESWPDSANSVLACIDFSDYSDRVADEAASIAAFTGAKLILVHAHSNPFDVFHWGLAVVDISDEYTLYKESLQCQLDNIAGRLRKKHAGLTVESELLYGVDYTKVILARVKQTDINVVIIGAKGRSNLSYVLLGSTTEKMLRETDVSVLTVRQ